MKLLIIVHVRVHIYESDFHHKIVQEPISIGHDLVINLRKVSASWLQYKYFNFFDRFFLYKIKKKWHNCKSMKFYSAHKIILKKLAII